MTTVTVFRRVPRPVIGVCGVTRDRGFEAFEERLDWLETTGVLVERCEPATAPEAPAAHPAAAALLAREGGRCLPLVLVDGAIACSGRIPSRSELARAVGLARGHGDDVPESPLIEDGRLVSRR